MMMREPDGAPDARKIAHAGHASKVAREPRAGATLASRAARGAGGPAMHRPVAGAGLGWTAPAARLVADHPG